MATKAERFKSETQRSGPKKPPQPKRRVKKDAPPDEAEGRRVEDAATTAKRNVSKRAAKKAEVALEDSATGRPSRKSTRGSANRGKIASSLERRTQRKVSSPKARSTKNAAKAQRGKKTPAR